MNAKTVEGYPDKVRRCKIPLWSGLVHFFTKYAESFTNLVRGSISKVFTSDIFDWRKWIGYCWLLVSRYHPHNRESIAGCCCQKLSPKPPNQRNVDLKITTEFFFPLADTSHDPGTVTYDFRTIAWVRDLGPRAHSFIQCGRQIRIQSGDIQYILNILYTNIIKI